MDVVTPPPFRVELCDAARREPGMTYKEISIWLFVIIQPALIVLFFALWLREKRKSTHNQHGVHRHINWNNHRPDLKEDLAHLVQEIKRRICGIASAGIPSSSA